MRAGNTVFAQVIASVPCQQVAGDAVPRFREWGVGHVAIVHRRKCLLGAVLSGLSMIGVNRNIHARKLDDRARTVHGKSSMSSAACRLSLPVRSVQGDTVANLFALSCRSATRRPQHLGRIDGSRRPAKDARPSAAWWQMLAQKATIRPGIAHALAARSVLFVRLRLSEAPGIGLLTFVGAGLNRKCAGSMEGMRLSDGPVAAQGWVARARVGAPAGAGDVGSCDSTPGATQPGRHGRGDSYPTASNMAAPLSAIMMVAAFVLAEVTVGITDASITRRR